MIKVRGYVRPDGKIGIRNHLLVIPSSVCAYETARRIGDEIEESVVIPNQQGCGQIGEDLKMIFRTLAGLGKNPNVGGVLVVGLGCDAIQGQDLADEIAKSGKPVECLIIQENGGTLGTIEKGKHILRKMWGEISACQVDEVDLSRIILGLECGGSDATSGLAANPALGKASDLFIEMGGSVLLSEVTEIIGAEHIIAARIKDERVKRKLFKAIEDIEKRAFLQRTDLRGTQPSPGNMKGGISTLEEKSLGCIYKAGTAPVVDFLDYGEEVRERGLSIMDTPGQDIESMIGMLAGGVQVIAFTTGRGTPAGSPIAPVIKITGNSSTYERMKDNIDIDASKIIQGKASVEEIGKRIFEEIIEVCNGKKTKSEIHGHKEFALWRIGYSY